MQSHVREALESSSVLSLLSVVNATKVGVQNTSTFNAMENIREQSEIFVYIWFHIPVVSVAKNYLLYGYEWINNCVITNCPVQ